MFLSVVPNSILPQEFSMVYVRLASIYYQQATDAEDIAIEEKKAKLAAAMYLKACELNPTSRSWLGVGKACLLLKEYKEAEDALSVSKAAIIFIVGLPHNIGSQLS
jgi:predicted Zn-dependent protease